MSQSIRGIARLYIFNSIPLHSQASAVVVYSDDRMGELWWAGFRAQRRWVQVLILCNVISLRVPML
jgi:DNA topoisomerase VI subunit B